MFYENIYWLPNHKLLNRNATFRGKVGHLTCWCSEIMVITTFFSLKCHKRKLKFSIYIFPFWLHLPLRKKKGCCYGNHSGLIPVMRHIWAVMGGETPLWSCFSPARTLQASREGRCLTVKTVTAITSSSFVSTNSCELSWIDFFHAISGVMWTPLLF